MSDIRPQAVAVKPLEDYRLIVTFDNNERRIFDVRSYIKGSWFGKLKDIETFRSVRVAGLSIEWPDGQDICPDCLYNESVWV